MQPFLTAFQRNFWKLEGLACNYNQFLVKVELDFVIWSSKKGHTGDARASGRDEGRGFLR